MDPEVKESSELTEEQSMNGVGTQLDTIESSENVIEKNEPSEKTTTDKCSIAGNDIDNHKEVSNSEKILDVTENDVKHQITIDDLDEYKSFQVQLEPKKEISCNRQIKELNQDVEDEEEVAEKDNDDEKKVDKEKSSQDPVNQDGSHFDRSLFLGRNRRVRQKNRYFLDFHCTDLTKGARSNRDDYDTFTPNSGARSSNRRSTIDSNRGQPDETEVFESRYCRKCLSKTAHDFDGGCQACLYKKIVESSKRQKPSSQRNRSANLKQSHDNNEADTLSSATSTTTTATATTTTTTTSNKRKATKQGGSRINNQTLINNLNNNNHQTNSNINNNIGYTSSNNPTAVNNVQTNHDVATEVDSIIKTNPGSQVVMNSSSVDGIKNDHNSGNKLPKLDSWTPEEVSDYILSKGFVNEAELFKTQSVDGISLLLMQRTDFTYGLKIKLGPALKIYDQVCKLKKEYFQTITTQ